TAMKDVILEQHISLLIDATHPYAIKASETAREVCRETGIPYCRYERPAVALPDYGKLVEVASADEAAKVAAKLGQVIFLTTGSRTLGTFAKESLLKEKRLIARVLPDPEVLTECFELGFTPQNIIAMQGPFSQKLNKAMFAECGAEVVVMKNSGTIGGSDTKLLAAMELSLFLVVITRPPLLSTDYPLFSKQEEVIMWAADKNVAMDRRC
nr:precorrin-6A reductase [Sporomusaceae bacterium]